MENKTDNKYIAVAYKLYADIDGTTELIEEATSERPFVFISGMGITLEDFEAAVLNVEKGDDFDITLEKEKAYGDIDEEKVVDLEREVFTINGKFDEERVVVDAVLPMQNEEGQRFYGRILEIGDKTVKVDFNHPLAGLTLNFKGTVVENRTATNEEIQSLINQLSGGCGGGCGNCGDDCGGGCENGGCGNGGCGNGGCGCGGCE